MLEVGSFCEPHPAIITTISFKLLGMVAISQIYNLGMLLSLIMSLPNPSLSVLIARITFPLVVPA